MLPAPVCTGPVLVCRIEKCAGLLAGANDDRGDVFEDDDGIEEFLAGEGRKVDGFFADGFDFTDELFPRDQAPAWSRRVSLKLRFTG